MAYEPPDWADALKNVLYALAKQKPKPLLAALAVFADDAVTNQNLAAFVLGADENDSALTQLRMALAGWDADPESEVVTDADGKPTQPRTGQRRAGIYDLLQLDEVAAEAISTRAPVYEVPVTVISKRFEPWYAEQHAKRTSVYWDDYEQHLRDTKKWSAEAIASLGQTTTDVVERLSDPTRETIKQTKGLVVGYVQSGKTANFTGVVAKAIDAGYRLIIVLTGTIEILRAQTQRRMDMELIGVENILRGLDPTDPQIAKELDYQQDTDWLAGRFLKHGDVLDQPNVVSIERVTTHRSDYERLPQGLTRLRFQKVDKAKALNNPENLFRSDAYVAIIKKNSAPLKKLIADLTPIKGDLAQLPVLIIDDESDQASVDTTNPAKWTKQTATDRQRTATNRLITDLLRLCPRAQYVGYTATPFANVFVDPDDERDLFPSDFVLSLHRPPGYMGVQEFHDVGKDWDGIERSVVTSNEMAHVRSLLGDVDSNPDGRRAELQEALDAWVLSGAIKKYREAEAFAEYRHHTMLVHESVKQAEHLATSEDVRDLWKTSRFTGREGLARLRMLYDDDFRHVMIARSAGAPIPQSFDQLKPFVAAAIAEMTVDGDPVLIVNSDKEVQQNQRKLDFEADRVWRILVGGTQLSRGFTVEGLTVSYFRRKAGQADTLMQAGRWFGFRPGYQDLVRLYIRRDHSVDLYEAFEALLMDEEAFREELRQYEGFDEDGMPLVEPRQIPPLVSQHLPWLRPTARNKMWNAVIESKATGGSVLDLYGLPPQGSAANQSNLSDVGLPLLARATNWAKIPYQLSTGASGLVDVRLGTINAEDFFSLFEKLAWHEEYDVRIDPLKRFLSKAIDDGHIEEWAVVWPQPTKGANEVDFPALGGMTPVITRKRRSGRIDFIGSDAKHRAAVLPIALGEQVPGLAAAAGRGVALISLVDDRSGDKAAQLTRDDVVPLISLAVPSSATPHKRDLIQWTVRVQDKADDATVEVID